MTQPSAPVPIEVLLSQSDWVRRLAFSLTRDPAEADDLVQETWLVVAQHPPAHASNLKSWLRTVMKNLRRKRYRASSRREAREQAVAQTEVAGDVAELAARASMLSKVAGHVHSLDEAHRTVVLLRYFDDLPPRKIAERIGVPVNTVNSRLQRAHAKLRDVLRDEFGDGWAAALLPLLRWPPSGGNAPDAPVATQASRIVRVSVAVAAVAAVGVAIVLATRSGRPPDSTSRTGEVEAAAAAVSGSDATPGRRRSKQAAAADKGSSPTDAAKSGNAAEPQEGDETTIRATGRVTAFGPPAGRLTLRLTPLAAAKNDIAGAVRTVELASGPFDLRLPRVDEKGRRIAEWLVEAEAAEQLPRRFRVRVPLPAEGGDLSLSEIALTPAPIATGIVNWNASPGETARVGSFLLDRQAPMQPFDAVRTAPGATFRLRLPPGQRAVVVAVVEDCVPLGREVDVTAPGDERSAGEFALTRGHSIRGRVSTGPVALEPKTTLRFWAVKDTARCLDFDGFWVSWDGTSARRYGAVLKPGADGSFAAGGFEREPLKLTIDYLFRVSGEIYDPAVSRPIEPPADLTELEFQGVPLSFVVTSGGAPVDKAYVTLTAAAGRRFGGPTDAAGASNVLAKPGSTYPWRVELEGFLPAEGTVTAPASGSAPPTSVELTAVPKEAPATWTVRLRSADGGVPAIAGFGFFAVSAKGTFSSVPRFVRDVTPTDGVFRIQDVPAGRWRLEIRPGCEWYDPSAFETAPPFTRQLGPGEKAEDDATSAPAGRAVLDVKGLEGVETIDWPLRIRNDAHELVAVGVSTRGPTFTNTFSSVPFDGAADVFPALPPGRYTVEADAEVIRKLDGFSVPFEIVAGRVTHVTVEVKRR